MMSDGTPVTMNSALSVFNLSLLLSIQEMMSSVHAATFDNNIGKLSGLSEDESAVSSAYLWNCKLFFMITMQR